METAVAEDAEVLGGGDGDAIFVEWTELDGVTVEWGFENRHGLMRVLRIWFGLSEKSCQLVIVCIARLNIFRFPRFRRRK